MPFVGALTLWIALASDASNKERGVSASATCRAMPDLSGCSGSFDSSLATVVIAVVAAAVVGAMVGLVTWAAREAAAKQRVEAARLER